MLDGYSSHIDLVSIDFCHNNNILLYVLPSNTTHLLQPCEIPFKKLKSEFDKASDRYRMNNDFKVITKYSFAQVLGEAFSETYTPNAIKNAYAATGIWLLNSNIINPDCLAPSLATEKPLILPPKSTYQHNTRASKTSQLEYENQELRGCIERLLHPGTTTMASIMKYPYPKPDSSQEKIQSRPKSFKFGALVTAESITKELHDKEETKQQKIEEVRLRKEQQAIKRVEKEVERQKKTENKKIKNARE
jgi:hypothetical protein